MKCISCGHEVPDTMKFCEVCGMPNKAAFEPIQSNKKAEPKAAFCMSCGAPLADGARFCTKCGKPVSGTVVSEQPKTAVQQPKIQQTVRPVAAQPAAKAAVPQAAAVPQPARQVSPAAPQAPVKPKTAAEYGLLGITEYMIDEKVSAFKFANSYKVYDAAGQVAGAIQQVNISGGVKAARVLLGSSAKSMQSFQYDLLDASGKKVASIKRGGIGGGFAALRNIQVEDGAGRSIGAIQVVPGWTPKLQILDNAGNQLALITGDWRGWNFRILNKSEQQIGTIDKKWNGFGREFFTSADKYPVSLSETIPQEHRTLVTAAAVSVDMILHEMR